MSLTDTQIRKLKPTGKCTPARPDKYTDGNNLRLWVRHTGNKVWVSDYTFAGKRESLTIGKYPAMSLQQAREANAKIKEQIANGINPKAEKAKYTAIHDGINLFSTIGSEWHERRKSHVSNSTYTKELNQYNKDILPFIGNKQITDITAPDILTIAQRIELRGAGDMARRAIQQIGQIFNHAIRTGKANHNPATGLGRALSPRKPRNFARIGIAELPQLLKDIDNDTSDPLTKLGFYFLCYTFVRTNELRFMQWHEIDFNARLWRIPAERMKMKRPHIVPLSPQALAILETIKAYNFSDIYVFFNTGTYKPFSENVFTNALKRMGY